MSSDKHEERGPSQERLLAFMMLDQMGSASNEQRCLRLNLCGFSHAEIAEILQISVSSVSTNIHAARKKASTTAKRAPKKAPGKS